MTLANPRDYVVLLILSQNYACLEISRSVFFRPYSPLGVAVLSRLVLGTAAPKRRPSRSPIACTYQLSIVRVHYDLLLHGYQI